MEDNFRLQTSKVYLTYSQCGQMANDLEYVKARLFEASPDITNYIVAREEHDDGGLHVHCYLALSKQLRTRNQRYYDIEYNGTQHPNMQGCRSPKHVAGYCVKDDHFLSNFDVQKWLDARSKRKARNQHQWHWDFSH
eukprot:gb/GECG01003452.1/.p1 GENE.gb/GECG01003452.1/~~gb/GECG01003452.1/.p1  ORF type:complete len:137 (+),score=9.99 gb/GECG01003452.1/:1-411(+)